MTLAELLVFGLATWRLTSLLMSEDGPYFLFVHLRYKVGLRNGEKIGQQGVYVDYALPTWRKEIGKAFLCQWCLSVWVGILWVILGNLGIIWDRVGFLVALPLAFSAIAILYQKLVD